MSTGRLLVIELAAITRRPTTYIALALLLLPAFLPTVLAPIGLLTLPPGSRLGFFMTLMILIGPLAALSVATRLLSEHNRRSFEVLWARGASAGQLTAIRILPALGCITGGLLLSAGAFSRLSPANEGSLGTLVASVITLTAAPVLLSFAAGCALGVLFGEIPALAIAMAAGAVSIIVPPKSLAFVPDVLGLGFFWDPAIGFGPDAAIITARLIWGGALALYVLAGTPLLLTWVDPRGLRRRRMFVGPALVPLVAAAYLNFQSAATAVTAIPPWTPATDSASLTTTSLVIDVDCSGGRIAGTSQITAIQGGTVRLALNPGLHVNSVSSSEPSVTWEQDRSGMVQIRSVGDGSKLTIRYAGGLAIHRDDYEEATPGLDRSQGTSLPIMGYLSREVCFLIRGGDWYPRAVGVSAGDFGSVPRETDIEVANAGEIVIPPGAESHIQGSSSAACMFVAMAHPMRSGRIVTPYSFVLAAVPEGWSQISERLRELDSGMAGNAVLLPLIRQSVPAVGGICAPASSLVSAQLGKRPAAEAAAFIWLQKILALDRRPAVLVPPLISTQEQFPRAVPGVYPPILATLQSAIADTFEEDELAVLRLRQEAHENPARIQDLANEGILGGPKINDGVLALHQYASTTGDFRWRRLLEAFATECENAPPTSACVERALARVGVDITLMTYLRTLG